MSTDSSIITVYSDARCLSTERVGTFPISPQDTCRTIELLNNDVFSYRRDLEPGSPYSPNTPLSSAPYYNGDGKGSSGISREASLMLGILIPLCVVVLLAILAGLIFAIWSTNRQQALGAAPGFDTFQSAMGSPPVQPPPMMYAKELSPSPPPPTIVRVAVPIPVSPYADPTWSAGGVRALPGEFVPF